jgi:Ca2+-binding RTX toxin-like protein
MPIFTGTNGPDNIKGGGEADLIDLLDGDDTALGGGGNDIIQGGEGDDRIDGEAGNDELFGEQDDDELSGGAGSDVLNGGSGFDRMSGGSGNDTFVLNADADDLDGGDGFDTINAQLLGRSLSLDLGAGRITIGGVTASETGVENAVGSGTADVLIGDAGDNDLDGGRGDDVLIGEGGNDELTGGRGADRLDGGAGVDAAVYREASAGVTLNLAQGGSGGDAAGDTFVGVEDVEGSDFADSILGDAAANDLDGNDGADALKGAGGADDLFGGSDNDNLSGGDGNDRLNGGGGADTMAGGNGDDVYVADDAGDSVDETGGSGIDRVESLVSFSLASDTTGVVENLTLIGFGNLDGVGNALANTLIGNNNANDLNGNSGADRMAGRGGNDSYVVNEMGDVVDESLAGSSGVDEVLSFVSLSLAGTAVKGVVENLRLAPGTAALNAAGNAADNLLVGNNGRNDLMGLAGDDTLTGNGGADTFVFNAPLDEATNVDVVTDFSVADDTLRLENAFMPGLATGTLAADAFRVGTTAVDASDRIIYNDDTGALFFDQDGSGAAAKVRFATLDSGLAMSNQDILVV